MSVKPTVTIEAARVRRSYYVVTLVLMLGISAVLTVSHYTILKSQNEATITRLEGVYMEATKAYLKTVIEMILAEIDLERRLVREDLGVRPGDIEMERKADAQAKKRMMVRIRAARLKDNGYIWINEVIDFKGGPRYARRLVHPFLADTEGMELSTEDAITLEPTPYRVELDGILADGEVFQTYYFAKPGEALPSLKLSYARLYPDFSWIVATGVYMDDLENTITREQSVARSNMLDQARTSMSGYIFALLVVAVLVVLIDKLTSRAIASSYGRMAASEDALRKEKSKVEAAYQLMKDLAERDELTGLRNRRSVLDRLAIEEARAKRTGSPFCLAIGDIDHFKAFNDRYGHNTGDAVLVAVAQAIESSVRLEDVASRWGGEEFLVLLSGDSLEMAVEAAERIRLAVKAQGTVVDGTSLAVTITFGVAEYYPGESLEELIARADRAMYQGKKAGRDMVVAEQRLPDQERPA